MSKGCGIVEYSTKDEAQTAINTLSNRSLMGRLIYVREVRTPTIYSSSSDTSYRTARLSRASTEAEVRAVAWVDHAEALEDPASLPVAVSVEDSADLACSRVAARRSSSPTYVYTRITHSRPKD